MGQDQEIGKGCFQEITTGNPQFTVDRPVTLTGYGLHGGQEVTVSLRPAEPGHGIVFQVLNGGRTVRVPAHIQYLYPCERSTALTNQGVHLFTVEHFLAACWGMEIDNLLVMVSADELPGFDGSCQGWLDVLTQAGKRGQGIFRKEMVVTRPIIVTSDGSCLGLYPAQVFRARFLLDYHPGSTRLQWVSYSERESFLSGLSKARTFAFRWEIDEIIRRGLGKGIRDHAFLVGETSDDPPDLRMPGEASYHKIVDIIGDIMLTGRRVRGEFVGIRSGHALNHRLAEIVVDEFNGIPGGDYPERMREG